MRGVRDRNNPHGRFRSRRKAILAALALHLALDIVHQFLQVRCTAVFSVMRGVHIKLPVVRLFGMLVSEIAERSNTVAIDSCDAVAGSVAVGYVDIRAQRFQGRKHARISNSALEIAVVRLLIAWQVW